MAEALEDGIATDPAALPPPDPRRGRPDGHAWSTTSSSSPASMPASSTRRRPARRARRPGQRGDRGAPTRSPAPGGCPSAARSRHGLQVAADPAGLTRVLANLIVNGIRHTPADGTVYVRARPVEGGVELAVSDGCGGIPEEDRERVFEVGYRGTAARTPDSPAEDVHTSRAGLGLAIVKGIVEAHHGQVAVENVEPSLTGTGAGNGGCFVVRAARSRPRPRSRRPRCEPRHALVSRTPRVASCFEQVFPH